jgi:hypothetical protein
LVVANLIRLGVSGGLACPSNQRQSPKQSSFAYALDLVFD